MEEGLAHRMTYGNDESNSITHYYAGKSKRKKKNCKIKQNGKKGKR
jgi:hypothetical protein